MGCRLHVAKTYKVEYGIGYFNYRIGEIESILNDVCDNVLSGQEGWLWEIDAELFQDGLKKLKDKKEFYQDRYNLEDDDINDIITSLEQIYNDADKSDGYVHINWY